MRFCLPDNVKMGCCNSHVSRETLRILNHDCLHSYLHYYLVANYRYIWWINHLITYFGILQLIFTFTLFLCSNKPHANRRRSSLSIQAYSHLYTFEWFRLQILFFLCNCDSAVNMISRSSFFLLLQITYQRSFSTVLTHHWCFTWNVFALIVISTYYMSDTRYSAIHFLTLKDFLRYLHSRWWFLWFASVADYDLW